MSKAQFLSDNLKPGETYAGIILGKNGEPDYHLAVIGEEAKPAPWKVQMEWAADLGGLVLTRRELRLCTANVSELFKPEWYWSSERHAAASDCAWCQNFGNGYQYYYHISYELPARAGRRLAI